VLLREDSSFKNLSDDLMPDVDGVLLIYYFCSRTSLNSAFLYIKESLAEAAIRIYNRIIRHKFYEILYKKKEYKYAFDAYDDMRLSDKDLLIDLKLGSAKAALIESLYDMPDLCEGFS
jgi:hypothetical protein